MHDTHVHAEHKGIMIVIVTVDECQVLVNSITYIHGKINYYIEAK